MADVFISYAQPDRPLAFKLAAMLEAEGWTTWRDTNLATGDDFGPKITPELDRARAVIVIWTDTSTKSRWVRSEANRASKQDKLIPIKLPHLTYDDLPQPFDLLLTENVGEDDKIKAAVVAQLAKPAVEPSPWALLTKGFRYELLTWLGIVGGALTLFTNLGSVLKLADWARVLVQHWKEWTHAFWVWAFSWLGIHVPPEWTPVLSFLLFGSLLTIGQAIQFRRTIKTKTDKYQGKSFQPVSWRTFFCVVFTLIATSLWLAWLPNFILFVWENVPSSILIIRSMSGSILYLFYTLMIVAGIVLFARHRLHAAVTTCLMGIFWVIISLDKLFSSYSSGTLSATAAYFTSLAMLLVLTLIILSVVPAKAVSRRLIFLALGLLLLIGLNELSKLGLDVTAPKLQG